MKRLATVLVWLGLALGCMAQPDIVPEGVDTLQTETTDEAFNADAEDEYATDAATDTSFNPIYLRSISADSLTALRARKAFEYMRYADSFFRASDQPAPAITRTPVRPGFFDQIGIKGLLWLLALGAVGWLLYTLVFSKSSLFARNPTLAATTNADSEDLPEALPAQSQIEQAVAAGNYRQATRYLYLLTLHKLGERGLVTLAPHKTNQQYQQELGAAQGKADFAALTLAYEFIWFGKYTPQTAQFEALHTDYKTFWSQWT
jgi:hypothetical protein